MYNDLHDQASKDNNILSKVLTADYTWVDGSGEDSRMSHKFALNRKWCWTASRTDSFKDAASSVTDTGTGV